MRSSALKWGCCYLAIARVMEFNELFKALDEELFKKLQTHLKDAERFVLEGAWQGQTYEGVKPG